MNIIDVFKNTLRDLNEVINPPVLESGLFTIKFGPVFEVTSTLNDKQMEAFILMLTNDLGVEIILDKLNEIKFINKNYE